jgi:hypothetical protein
MMTVRLHIPNGAPYLSMASALAGKFAEVAGCRREDVESLKVAFDHAAEDVVALEGCAGESSLNIECARGDGRVQVTISCGRHRAEVARSLP